MENTTIYTTDAAGQELVIVVVPGTAWVIKDIKGNEIANVMPPAQLDLIQATLKGDPAISRELVLDLNGAYSNLMILKEALKKIVAYTESGTTIGDLTGCQHIAQTALNSLK